MKKGVIDRFEGELAVIEFEGGTRDYRRAELPEGAAVGDMVVVREDGTLAPDPEGTAARKREIDALMEELFE